MRPRRTRSAADGAESVSDEDDHIDQPVNDGQLAGESSFSRSLDAGDLASGPSPMQPALHAPAESGVPVIISHEKIPTLKALRSVFDLFDFDQAVEDYEASTGLFIDRKTKVLRRIRRTICAPVSYTHLTLPTTPYV